MSTLERGALQVVRRLRASGYQALYAGGCARDTLLGKTPSDIDIATDATPERVCELFNRTVAVGAHFGVIIVLQGAESYEVATFRNDGRYGDGRRPETVSFSDARNDALRRDFTVNGLFLDPETREVVDYVGGRADLEAKILRAIGNPATRFSEDRLRLLRGVRLAASLGFVIEERTWEALCAAAPAIREVSAERIRDELTKIFTAPTRARGLDLLDESGLLEILLPDIAALKGCEQPPEFHPEGDVFQHTRLMLDLLGQSVSRTLAFATLLHDVGKPACAFRDPEGRIRFNGHEHVGADMAERILRGLRFSNETIRAVVEMVRHHMAFKDTPQMRTSRLRRFMARETFPEELELHRVDCLGSHAQLDIHRFLLAKQKEFADEPVIPPRLVRGDDLLDRGMKPGPRFREILDAIQTRQLEGELKTREEALEWLETHYPPH